MNDTFKLSIFEISNKSHDQQAFTLIKKLVLLTHANTNQINIIMIKKLFQGTAFFYQISKVLRYLSPVSGSNVTMRLPFISGLLATSKAAHKAAPEE